MVTPNIFNTVPKPTINQDLVLEAIFRQEWEERQKPSDEYRMVSYVLELYDFFAKQGRPLTEPEKQELEMIVVQLGHRGLFRIETSRHLHFTFNLLGLEMYDAWLVQHNLTERTHPHHRNPVD